MAAVDIGIDLGTTSILVYAKGKGIVLKEPSVVAYDKDADRIRAGIDITLPFGNLIVDIGGGTTDIAVISLGDTVVSSSLKVAGNDFDQAIIRYVRRVHNLFIGEQTAEAVKIRIGGAYPRPQTDTMEVKGRNVITGLPKTVTLTSEEVREALKETTAQIVEAIHGVLETTPPELAADIAERGIILTGGGSLLEGLEELIEETTGINTMTAENPAHAVAEGTGRYNEIMEKLGKI